MDCDGETEDDEEELDTSTSSDKTEEDKKKGDVSDDEMAVDEEVASEPDDDIPILQKIEQMSDEKAKDLASCGLWEEDEVAFLPTILVGGAWY